jgi:hypothetical protein
LEKGIAGNTQTLKRQMPWLDANKDGTVSMEEAVEGLTEAYGGAAEAAAEQDPFEKLRLVWEATKDTLGTALLPKLDELGEWLSSEEGQAAIEGWIAGTQGFAEAMADVADNIGPVIDGLDSIKDAYDALPDWFKKLQGKAFDFLGDASLPGVLSRLGGDQPRPPLPKPTGGINPVETRGVPVRNVNVTVINGKQEKSVDSAAMALRLDRAL